MTEKSDNLVSSFVFEDSFFSSGNRVHDEVRDFIKKHRIDVRKSLGQNFLVREEPLSLACQAAEVSLQDLVLEIGPGPGTLTRRLAQKAGAVVAVELDYQIAQALKKEFSQISNTTIIHGDALKIDPQHICQEYGRGLNFKVVANIPYYITSALLRHYLSGLVKPRVMVMLMQKEVALQATSKNNRSLLSLSVQYFGFPEVMGLVPKDFFYPIPKVDSALLRISIHNEKPIKVEEEEFFTLARHAFSSARKTLLNSLSSSLKIDKDAMSVLLLAAGAEFPNIRAGALNFAQWQKLYDTLRGKVEWK